MSKPSSVTSLSSSRMSKPTAGSVGSGTRTGSGGSSAHGSISAAADVKHSSSSPLSARMAPPSSSASTRTSSAAAVAPSRETKGKVKMEGSDSTATSTSSSTKPRSVTVESARDGDEEEEGDPYHDPSYTEETLDPYRVKPWFPVLHEATGTTTFVQIDEEKKSRTSSMSTVSSSLTESTLSSSSSASSSSSHATLSPEYERDRDRDRERDLDRKWKEADAMPMADDDPVCAGCGFSIKKAEFIYGGSVAVYVESSGKLSWLGGNLLRRGCIKPCLFQWCTKVYAPIHGENTDNLWHEEEKRGIGTKAFVCNPPPLGALRKFNPRGVGITMRQYQTIVHGDPANYPVLLEKTATRETGEFSGTFEFLNPMMLRTPFRAPDGSVVLASSATGGGATEIAMTGAPAVRISTRLGGADMGDAALFEADRFFAKAEHENSILGAVLSTDLPAPATSSSLATSSTMSSTSSSPAAGPRSTTATRTAPPPISSHTSPPPPISVAATCVSASASMKTQSKSATASSSSSSSSSPRPSPSPSPPPSGGSLTHSILSPSGSFGSV